MKLYQNLSEALENIRSLQQIMKDEKIADEKLSESLDQISRDIQKDFKPLKSFVEANKFKFEMIEFLNTALNREYTDMLNYKKYLDYITEPKMKDTLRALGEDEARHAAAITKLIKELGGTGEIEPTQIEFKQEITIGELIKEQLDNEKERISFYEKGISSFNYPELQWVIGNIKVEEEQHYSKIEGIYKGLKDKNAVLKRDKDGWFDPYMDDKGDRPWIEA